MLYLWYMWWIWMSVAAYFCNALVSVVDKTLLTARRIPNPALYAFYTGILSVGVLGLTPFGMVALPVVVMVEALLGGILFLVSLYFFYKAVYGWEISRVAPIVGAFSAMTTLLLSVIFFGHEFSAGHLVAFVLLVAALVILSAEHVGKVVLRWRIIGFSVLSAVLLGAVFVLSKEVFLQAPFITGFVWLRMGSVVAALAMLAVPRLRRHMSATHSQVSSGSLWWVVANKVVGALGFVLLNIAIAYGSVAIVNALKASEYAFVFLFALLLGVIVPHLLKEKMTRGVIIQKVIGVALMAAGIASLYLF